MAIELTKVPSVELRSVGCDERWLQQRIFEDPALLGLGELEVAWRELPQPTGGRLDFLMRDAEADTYYEVEVMLGALDESHIIRTIEYWDVERQRRPQVDHRPVIVAERITGRFFNVLRLLNRSVPMIAVQLNAFQLSDGSIALHPVTVLDVSEETLDTDDVGQIEGKDRAYWEKRSTAGSIAVMDDIVAGLEGRGLQPRLGYRLNDVAMATSGRNFCWFRPRKVLAKCHLRFRVMSEERDEILASLEGAGIDATPSRADRINLSLSADEVRDHAQVVIDALVRAEEASRA